jgi:hypothetical protein
MVAVQIRLFWAPPLLSIVPIQAAGGTGGRFA